MKPRFLDSTEFGKFKELFPGLDILNSNEHRIAVVEIEDEIVAYAVLELVPHVGAIFTIPNRRNQGLMKRLLQFLCRRANPVGFYMFPSTDIAKHVCMNAGLTRKDWEVWKKEF